MSTSSSRLKSVCTASKFSTGFTRSVQRAENYNTVVNKQIAGNIQRACWTSARVHSLLRQQLWTGWFLQNVPEWTNIAYIDLQIPLHQQQRLNRMLRLVSLFLIALLKSEVIKPNVSRRRRHFSAFDEFQTISSELNPFILKFSGHKDMTVLYQALAEAQSREAKNKKAWQRSVRIMLLQAWAKASSLSLTLGVFLFSLWPALLFSALQSLIFLVDLYFFLNPRKCIVLVPSEKDRNSFYLPLRTRNIDDAKNIESQNSLTALQSIVGRHPCLQKLHLLLFSTIWDSSRIFINPLSLLIYLDSFRILLFINSDSGLQSNRRSNLLPC